MSKNKDRTEVAITKVAGVDPNWLSKYVADDHSLDGMDEYRILPRVKVIQSMTAVELKKQFGEGSLIMRPGDVCLWKEGMEAVKFVALFFGVEFAKWNDRRDTSQMVAERSFSPTSELAKRARDIEKRFEVCPGQENKKDADKFHYRYIEHLRFFGVLYKGDMAGQFVAISFEKGEFYQGKNFISAIKMRKLKTVDAEGNESTVPAPLWAQVWELKGGFRPRGEKNWYGIDFAPAEEPTIDEADFDEFSKLHTEMKGLYEKQKLMVDEVDQVDEASAGDPAAANSKEF